MCPRIEKENRSSFRLRKIILCPLVVLLALPLLTVARGFFLYGPTTRNILSLFLTALIASLFLPWLTRRVVVSPNGILLATSFRRNFLPWAEVKKVSGYQFHGHGIVVLQGKRRLVIMDILGNFNHLVGHIMEHATEAVIDDDVAPLLMIRSSYGKDVLLLWMTVAGMAVLVLLKFMNRV